MNGRKTLDDKAKPHTTPKVEKQINAAKDRRQDPDYPPEPPARDPDVTHVGETPAGASNAEQG